MGGRRCGKTSLLASLFDQSINGVVNQYFTINDVTQHEVIDCEAKDSLIDKKYELKNFINGANNILFMADSNPTRHIWKYNLAFRLAGRGANIPMEMEFIDAPGERFQGQDQEIAQLVQDTDVYVVVIDTPYLMHDNPAIAEAANAVDTITNYLKAYMEGIEKRDAKMLIFAPIKCENWIRNNHGGATIFDVNDRIKERYETLITYFNQYVQNDQGAHAPVMILPMQTAGAISFCEYTDAKICNDVLSERLFNNEMYGINRRNIQRAPIHCADCGQLGIRLENGNIVSELKEHEAIVSALDYTITGDLSRPACWFEIIGHQYHPSNCDQLPLHIIRFMLMKEAEAANPRNFWTRMVARIRGIFGDLPLNLLQQAIAAMTNGNILKDNGEGIEIIQGF